MGMTFLWLSRQREDCKEDVLVIIAHDAAVRDAVDHYPLGLNF
jgi:hypothetical protein